MQDRIVLHVAARRLRRILDIDAVTAWFLVGTVLFLASSAALAAA